MTETSRFVESAGVRLAIREQVCSDEPQVLLLHGLGSDVAGAWESTGWLRMLDQAGLGWVAPDLRGHGASDKPHESSAYQLATLVADAVAVIAAANAAAVDVVGYSLGSRIAIELAARHPGRVSRLVLGGFGYGSSSSLPISALLKRLPASVDRDAVQACASGVGSSSTGLQLGGMRAPALLVAGENDRFAGSIERLAEQLEHARSARLAGRDHFTTLSASTFKRLARDFLGEGR